MVSCSLTRRSCVKLRVSTIHSVIQCKTVSLAFEHSGNESIRRRIRGAKCVGGAIYGLCCIRQSLRHLTQVMLAFRVAGFFKSNFLEDADACERLQRACAARMGLLLQWGRYRFVCSRSCAMSESVHVP